MANPHLVWVTRDDHLILPSHPALAISSVQSSVTFGAQRDQVLFLIVSRMASELPVMHL